MRAIAVALVLAVMVSACGKDDDWKPVPAAEKTAESNIDPAAISDPNLAASEMEKRLAQQVQAHGAVIVVKPWPTQEVLSYFLPPTAPWIISCGVGASIVMGAAASGDRESVANEVEVRLAFTVIKQKDCDIIGPRLAKRLTEILKSAM